MTKHIKSSQTIHEQLSEKEKELNALYNEIREVRNASETDSTKLQQVFKTVEENHATDWLLPLEIYELVAKVNSSFSQEVLKYLSNLKQERPKVAHN